MEGMIYKFQKNRIIMKTKFISVMLFLVLIMGIEGCEDKEPQYEIYENHNMSACGVEDPLENIEWLSEYCKKVKGQKDISSIHIYLLKVIDKDEYIFEISVPSQIEHYYSTNYRNCSGDIVFRWETVSTPNPSYQDFIKDKELITELFYMVKQ